jgi:hypothetical protein
MLKQLLITVAASASLAGIALSQTPAQSPATTGQPAVQQKLAMQQTPNELLASQLKGTEVIDSNNQKVGSVSDILFDRNGNILAYLVSEGGFLGLGAKDIAINPSAFHMQPAADEGSTKLKLAMSKDDLKAMPEFKPYREPSEASTVGQGSPTTRMAPPNGATGPGIPPAPRQ